VCSSPIRVWRSFIGLTLPACLRGMMERRLPAPVEEQCTHAPSENGAALSGTVARHLHVLVCMCDRVFGPRLQQGTQAASMTAFAGSFQCRASVTHRQRTHIDRGVLRHQCTVRHHAPSAISKIHLLAVAWLPGRTTTATPLSHHHPTPSRPPLGWTLASCRSAGCTSSMSSCMLPPPCLPPMTALRRPPRWTTPLPR
jgi:hypothetical protein